MRLNNIEKLQLQLQKQIQLHRVLKVIGNSKVILMAMSCIRLGSRSWFGLRLNGVLLLAALLFFGLAKGQTADKAPLKLRVGTFNVGHFNQGIKGGLEIRGKGAYPNNKTVTGKYVLGQMLGWRKWIGAQSLDIFAVEEWNYYFDQDSTFKATDELLKPYYNNIHFGTQNTWIYNGIATNYQLTNIREKHWSGEYYALIGDIKIGETTLTFISTHIPWQKQTHAPALQALLQELKKYPYFICCGDMNASDKDQLLFKQAGFNIANGGNMGWFPTTPGALARMGMLDGANRHIDQIVTSPNIKIMNVSAPHTGLNDEDHLPILADLVVTW